MKRLSALLFLVPFLCSPLVASAQPLTVRDQAASADTSQRAPRATFQTRLAKIVERKPDASFSSERLQRVEDMLHRYVDENRHAGVVWLIARFGQIVDFQSYGYRDLEARLPMEKDTICRIYSMSKIVTSVAVLILLEEGRIGLDDPIARYLPELKEAQVMTGGTAENPELEPTKSPVTIKHLLTHTSGYGYDFAGNDPIHQLYKKQDLWNSNSLKEFIGRVAKLSLFHHPGEKFTYGINNDILGALVETVSGKTFEEFMHDRIFDPLEMTDTAFHVPPEKTNRLAKIYSQGEDGKLVETHDFLGAFVEQGRGIPCGGAGLFSTVADYARFAQMLLNGGAHEGKRILSRKTVELMTANHLQHLPGENHGYSQAHGWGLGVEVRLDLGRSSNLGSPGQFGWYGAATTYCQIDPKENLVAILFTQHFPFNQHGVFDRFANTYYSALGDGRE